MLSCFKTKRSENAIAIYLIDKNDYLAWLDTAPNEIRSWLTATKFNGEVGQYALLPTHACTISQVIVIIDQQELIWALGQLPYQLPALDYYLANYEDQYYQLALGFGLGAYVFDRYKKPQRDAATLYVDEKWQQALSNVLNAIYSVRNWINTPTDDLGPSEFAREIVAMAKTYGATCTEIIGDALLRDNYPCIYTVGRASDDAPRLLDLRYGNQAHPKITLVGKGVCFDTGGLDLKSAAYMQLMKKDMGGAAHVLGLAQMIMQAKLPVSLRVLVPLVENAVSGNAYRPGDVIKSRKGLTIEIGNTDAEGRLVLADALTEAASEEPDLLIDIATLTGAARVALGTELPAVFSNNDEVIHKLLTIARTECDPLWPMPLFAPYKDLNKSNIADLNNNPSESYGGAIAAALFLQAFVPNTIPWLHFDLMAWNVKSKPGRPMGGEAMGLRGLFAYLYQKYGDCVRRK